MARALFSGRVREIGDEWYNSPGGFRVLSSSPVRSKCSRAKTCSVPFEVGWVRREADTKGDPKWRGMSLRSAGSDYVCARSPCRQEAEVRVGKPERWVCVFVCAAVGQLVCPDQKQNRNRTGQDCVSSTKSALVTRSDLIWDGAKSRVPEVQVLSLRTDMQQQQQQHRSRRRLVDPRDFAFRGLWARGTGGKAALGWARGEVGGGRLELRRAGCRCRP